MSRFVGEVRRLAALALALAAGAAGGQVPGGEDAEPEGSVVLEEIEVKSGRAPGVETLEVREVRETPAKDLGEALDRGAGLAKVRKGGIANDVVLRGMKRDDVSVRIDGAAVHGACPARMDPPSFHLDYAEVDRVEVSRGPFDVTRPGGLAGGVEVHTRGPVHRGAGGEVNAGYGETGAFEASLVGAWSGERTDVLLGGAFKQARPYVTGDGRNLTEVIPASRPARFRDTRGEGDAYTIGSGWVKAGFAPAAGQRLELAYTRQQADEVLYPYLAMDGLRDDTDRLNATWRAAGAGGGEALVLQAYGSLVAHDMDDRLRCSASSDVAGCGGELPRAWSMRTEARSRTWGVRLEVTPGLLEGLRLGADAQERSWDNTTTRLARMAPGMPYRAERQIPDVTIRSAGLWAELRRTLAPRLRGSAGVRGDVARSSPGVDRSELYEAYHGGSPSLERTDVLLSGNVRAEWDALPGATLFAAYGHGARVPDPQERYIALSAMAASQAAWVGDPRLDPARSDEVDAGVRVARGGVLVNAQGFHAWVTDHVTLAEVTVASGGQPLTAKTYENVAARTWGGEITLRAALPWNLFARAGASLTLGRNVSRGGWLAEVPPLSGAAALRWDDGRLFAEVEEAVAADQERVDGRLGEARTPGWAMTNLRAGAEWRGARVFAGVTNVFDRHVVEHLSYQRDPFSSGVRVPEPGRTLYLNGQFTF